MTLGFKTKKLDLVRLLWPVHNNQTHRETELGLRMPKAMYGLVCVFQ